MKHLKRVIRKKQFQTNNAMDLCGYLFGLALMRSILLIVAIFSAALTCSFYSYAQAADTTIQLQSYYRQDSSNCLVSQGYDADIMLSECAAGDKSASKFALLKRDDGYYTIRPISALNQCLRSFADSQKIKPENCDTANISGNYISMYSWSLIEEDGFYKLQNKYKSDSGSIFSCIVTHEENKTVTLGECSSDSVNAEFKNALMWKIIRGEK